MGEKLQGVLCWIDKQKVLIAEDYFLQGIYIKKVVGKIRVLGIVQRAGALGVVKEKLLVLRERIKQTKGTGNETGKSRVFD